MTSEIERSGISRPRILLSVQNTTDRKMIARNLPETYQYLSPDDSPEDREPDLVLTDYDTYRAKRDSFVRMKKQALPVHLPILLLTNDDRVLQQNGQVWNIVDDIVEIPVPVKVLNARIKNLLRTRRYSQKLRQSNLELQEEKDRYKLLAENSTDMVTLHDLEGDYRYVSPASADIMGYDPEELVGRNMYEFIHPGDRVEIATSHQHVLKENLDDTKRVSYRLLTREEGYVWVETVGKLIQHPETGEPLEIQAATRDISDRKAYEEQLQNERDFINAAMDNMPGIFFLVDDQLNYVFWNRNLVEELGYEDEEILEMDPFDFFPEHEHRRAREKIERILGEGQAEMDVDIVTKNGKTKNFHLIGSRLMRDGNAYIVGSGVDITQRKEAEYRSEQQKQLLEAIINQSDSIIYVKDRDGIVQLVNRKYLDLFGLKREEVIGKTDEEIHGEELAKTFRESDRKVIESGNVMELEEKVPVGGQIRTYLSIKYPLKNVPGFENCICGISTNITDRKNILTELRERVKEQNCLYRISSLTEQVLTVEQLLEKAVTFIPGGWQYPDITEASIRFGEKAYETERYKETPWTLTAENHRIPDHPLVIKVSYQEPRTVVDGSAFLEEERQLIDTLADNISLQIDRILAEERVKQSLREKDVLLHEIHHRVKNNLAVVSSLLELQRMQSGNEHVNRILSNSQMRIHSMGLIHEKLYKSDSLSEIDFHTYIEELVTTITKTIDTQNRITIDVDCESITLNVNQAVPCALIINEIISNAVEHAFPGQAKGTITIRLREEDNRLNASIKDDGVGLPEDFHNREHHSMGYTIIETLIQQLEAEFEVSSNEGTEIFFSYEKQSRRGSSSNLP